MPKPELLNGVRIVACLNTPAGEPLETSCLLDRLPCAPACV